MIGGFLESFAKLRQFRLHYDDDFIDRLSRRYSVLLLVIFTALVSTKQYVGDPISCWVPAQFTGSHVEYTNYICWISNTYYLPWKDKIPGPNDLKKAHLNYYQWVPFILLTQAFMFYSPSIIWHSFSSKTGFDINTLVKLINNSENLNPELREKTLRYLAKHMDKALEIQRDSNSKISKLSRLFNKIFCFLFFHKRHGNYLLSVYLFTKVLFILNVFVQFFLLNNFLGNNYKLFGIEVIVNLLKSSSFSSSLSSVSSSAVSSSQTVSSVSSTQGYQTNELIESPRFPRVTMCHFQVRFLGDNIHDYVVQCALPINLFNEKIFIFIWFWLVYVAFASIYGLLLWLWYLLPWNRVNFLKKYLKTMDRKTKEKFDKKMFRTFDRYYLKQDGVLVLRLIGKNSNQVFMGELMLALWENFKRNQDYAGVFV
ncbi:unnamed protein product [Brachionus calyciflorus]|uniref:Innexin n=1 Tax=Brachionus calyciflorus TaxID=104777 RepID=A0A814EF00_9BILA|nr:unnamed protein product [Brachionus calyciflorus]